MIRTARLTEKDMKVLEAIKESEKPLTVEEIASKTGINIPTLCSRHILRLIKQGCIEETHKGSVKAYRAFKEIYDELNAEMSLGFSTSMVYLNLLRRETQANFKHMDEKYDAISKAMLAVVDCIEERNKTFENRIEKTEKNIESLLKILAEK